MAPQVRFWDLGVWVCRGSMGSASRNELIEGTWYRRRRGVRAGCPPAGLSIGADIVGRTARRWQVRFSDQREDRMLASEHLEGHPEAGDQPRLPE